MITFLCRCGKKWTLGDEWAGKLCRCPECATTGQVPGLPVLGSAAISKPAQSSPGPAASSNATAVAPRPAQAGPGLLSVQGVCNRLVRDRLMSTEEVRTIFQRWAAQAKQSAEDVSSFVKWLVATKQVTDYQAAVLAGRRNEPLWLGGYKVLLRVAQGPLAGIYKGVHPQGQVVAIKVLPAAKAADPQVLGRFQRESRLATRLQHPNVTRTLVAGEEQGVHFLVQEYLEGQTLKEVLTHRSRLPTAEAVRLVHQILQGLQHLHEEGLVHRDLEPGNLMLVADGTGAPADTNAKSTVKILDIGLGRAIFDEGAPGAAEVVTTSGEQLGTPEYRAPEQARDPHGADIRADIYSVGCILYHMLVGDPPFVEKNVLRLMIRHAQEKPSPLSAFGLQVPPGLQAALDRMLAKDPALRYSTPAEAVKDLRPFLAG